MSKHLDLQMLAIAKFGELAIIRRSDLHTFAKEEGYTPTQADRMLDECERAGHGKYRLPTMNGKTVADITAAPQPAMAAQVIKLDERKAAKHNLNAESEHEYARVPDKDKLFVPFGDFETIYTAVEAGMFFPIFVSGMSGNGKTYMIEQAAAQAGRPMIRVQMTRETDEDDLIGGFRLINGETKYVKGPVIRAMEIGALLLIDEADRGDPSKIMCLQGILEGKPYYVKKTGEIVKGAPGFNIIVTANTKGRGSDDGRYIAASVLDDAWLERFTITIEQQYPDASTERRILKKYFEYLGLPDEADFIGKLTKWSEMTRKSFEEHVVEDVITTRRLTQIAKTYSLFKNRIRAIELATNRFDADTRSSFIELYKKLDETVVPTDDGQVKTDPGVKVHTDPAF